MKASWPGLSTSYFCCLPDPTLVFSVFSADAWHSANPLFCGVPSASCILFGVIFSCDEVFYCRCLFYYKINMVFKCCICCFLFLLFMGCTSYWPTRQNWQLSHAFITSVEKTHHTCNLVTLLKKVEALLKHVMVWETDAMTRFRQIHWQMTGGVGVLPYQIDLSKKRQVSAI